MGWPARTLELLFSPVRNLTSFAPVAIPTWQAGRPLFSDGKFESFAREGYQANELVYAGIEELSTSAAEPRMRAKVRGEWVENHPILTLFDRPNAFMDRFSFWANVIMYLSISGNAYALIVRSGSGRPVQLWLMRPDLVDIVPSVTDYIARYEYRNGSQQPIPLPVGDVIHWKHRNPLDQFYGQSPLLAGAGRIDIDNFMKGFVKTFFTKAGIPAGQLTFEGALDEATIKELKQRWSGEFGGPSGWHGIMVTAKNKATFTPMTRDLGSQGLVVPELDEIAEARILMLLGVPPELVGARVGMQNSSYAQKRSARESFWDETLSPLYELMAGAVNLRLVPNYPGVDEIGFDFSTVRALQDDEDAIHARVGKDVQSSLITIEEGRAKLGLPPIPSTGTFLIPANFVPVPAAKVGDDSVDLSAVRVAPPAQIAAPGGGNVAG